MTQHFEPLSLAEVPLFCGLTAQQLAVISGDLHALSFPSGANVMVIEQPGEVMYIVQQGVVKVTAPQLDGSGVILTVLGPGETVGEMAMLDGNGRSATVVTLQESRLFWASRTAVLSWLERNPTICHNLIHILSQRLRRADEQIAALATLSVRGRVAHALISLAEKCGRATMCGDIRLPLSLTQSDIGAMVGASRERVNAAMRTYTRHRHISIDREHYIIIHDSQALARAARI